MFCPAFDTKARQIKHVALTATERRDYSNIRVNNVQYNYNNHRH